MFIEIAFKLKEKFSNNCGQLNHIELIISEQKELPKNIPNISISIFILNTHILLIQQHGITQNYKSSSSSSFQCNLQH